MWFLCTTRRCCFAVDAVDVAVVDVDGILAHQSLDGHIDVSAILLFELLLHANQIDFVEFDAVVLHLLPSSLQHLF